VLGSAVVVEPIDEVVVPPAGVVDDGVVGSCPPSVLGVEGTVDELGGVDGLGEPGATAIRGSDVRGSSRGSGLPTGDGGVLALDGGVELVESEVCPPPG
jgi:hypothetical protein